MESYEDEEEDVSWVESFNYDTCQTSKTDIIQDSYKLLTEEIPEEKLQRNDLCIIPLTAWVYNNLVRLMLQSPDNKNLPVIDTVETRKYTLKELIEKITKWEINLDTWYHIVLLEEKV